MTGSEIGQVSENGIGFALRFRFSPGMHRGLWFISGGRTARLMENGFVSYSAPRRRRGRPVSVFSGYTQPGQMFSACQAGRCDSRRTENGFVSYFGLRASPLRMTARKIRLLI